MRSALLILLAATLAACGAPGTSPAGPTGTESASPTRICDVGNDGGAPPISCTEAIGQVLLALGPEAQTVQAAWYRPGAPCPPNARCMAPPPGNAYVVLRLDGAQIRFVPLRTEGGETVVGVPDVASFDLWPPSGEAIPEVARPDVGQGVPVEIADRSAFPLCLNEGAGAFDSPSARRCFLGAVLDGRPAELHTRSADERGGFKELYRYSGRGSVLVYQDRPEPVDPGWVRKDCAIGPAFDDTQVFVVGDCLSTELS